LRTGTPVHRAALAAVLVRDDAPELRLVHEWLDSWSGIGLIIAGMTHQAGTCSSPPTPRGDCRANFFPVDIAHSIVGGSAWEPTPWRAVQRAARPFRARGYPVTPALYVVAIFAC
jgi:hypothetical protein